MAEVPCAGTGEKSIEKGDATVIFATQPEAPHGPTNHLRQGLRHRRARGFRGDAGSAALRPADRCLRQHHIGDPRPFLGPAGQELHRLRPAVRPGHDAGDAARYDGRAPERRRRPAGRPAEDPARQRRHALVDLQPAAWRAGRAVAVGQPLPHPGRPGGAGIRRQPGARGGAPRRGLHPLHRHGAGASRCRSARPSPRCWPTW